MTGRTSVALAGLGGVGRTVLERLLSVDEGFDVTAVSVRREDVARELLDHLGSDAVIVPVAELSAHAKIVIEALPPALFRECLEPAIARGCDVIVLSCGALLEHWDLVDLAKQSGARLLIPSGAILGLDGVQAAAVGEITSVRMTTRKPVKGLLGSPMVEANFPDLASTKEPVLLFRGTPREAISGFPSNLNVAVAVSLAGIGPDRTELEVWADPSLTLNTHHVDVVADSANLRFTIENVPSENVRTGRITALSVIAMLRKMRTHLVVGT